MSDTSQHEHSSQMKMESYQTSKLQTAPFAIALSSFEVK